MARIPTILSSGNVRTGQVAAQTKAFLGAGEAPRASFAGAEAQAAAGRSIGAGLQDLSQGLMSLAQMGAKQKQMKEQRQQYDNHLWSESQYTSAQREWIQWMDDSQKNGSEVVVEQFTTKFEEYQKKVLESAPNDDARNRLKLKLDDLGTRVFEGALRIEASNRAQNTVNTFSQMLQDTVDVVAQDPYSHVEQQARLIGNLNIAKEQGRITEETYLKLKDQAQNIAVVAAEAVVAKDPDYAESIINSAEGIDWTRRKAVLGEIERSRSSNDTLFRYQQQELLKSTLDSIIETGRGVSSFDVESYVIAFGKDQQAAARADAVAKIEMANNIYSGKSELMGKPPGEIADVLAKYRPQAGDADFSNKQVVFEKLAELADQQVKLLQRDPFSYARQDPVVDRAWDLVEGLPKDAKPELIQQLASQAIESSIGYQRKLGVSEGQLSAMSQASAAQYAQRINTGDTQQVQTAFAQLQQTYGKYYAYAFRDLVRLPEGQRVDAASQVVALHMGKPFLTDFIAAVRTPVADMKIDNKDAQQLREQLVTNPQFMAFKGAMLSANPGAASMVNDFNQAIEKYAQSIYFRGKAKNPADAVKQATELVVGSAYGFATVDGTPVAIKRQQGQTYFSDDDVKIVGSALGQFQKTIDPSKIDTSKFMFPLTITDDLKHRSIQDTIRSDSFWVTNPQNDGAILYMNGMDGTTAPVKWKDGRVVEAPFTLALSYGKTNADIAESKRAKWYQMPITGFYPIMMP